MVNVDDRSGDDQTWRSQQDENLTHQPFVRVQQTALKLFFLLPPIFESTIWVNYNDLTATSLEIMVNKENHPQMALFQVSEI